MMRNSRGKLYRPLQPCVVRMVSYSGHIFLTFSATCVLKTATTCELCHVLRVVLFVKMFTRSHYYAVYTRMSTTT